MRKLGIMLAAVVFSGAAGQLQAAPISQAWTGGSDGDNISITFTAFYADTLDDITGGGYSHNHGNTSVVFGIDLRIDGVWTTVYTWSHDGFDHLLSEQTSGGPISFAGGMVDGIRLTDVPIVGFGYHGMNGSYLDGNDTVFVFDTAVPEPGTLALAGMGLLGMAGYVRRRRRAKLVA